MPLFGLIGKTLVHSFSEHYFNQKFKSLGLSNYSYRNFPINSVEEVLLLIQSEPDLAGLNITIPFKEVIIPHLNDIDDEARAIGAVNTLKITRHQGEIRTKGFNSDAYGFRMSIKPFLTKEHHRAMVLGSGGASKAVVHVLKSLGIDVLIVSRNPQSGELSWKEINSDLIKHFPMVVNTTPLGMYPENNSLPPIPYEGIGENHFLVDLVYNPEETLFLRKGKEKGAVTLNGLSMLHLQADRSWEIWTQ